MTDLLAWLNPARWLMLFAVAGSLVLGYALWVDHQQGIGEARANARWIAATARIKAEAAATLATETDRVRATEAALQEFKTNQELKDANHQKTVADLGRSLRAVAGPAGRLRDPNGGAGCGGGGDRAPGQAATGAGDRADDSAQSAGLLSEQLSELLFARLDEADTINIAYIACRADTDAIRAAAATPLAGSR